MILNVFLVQRPVLQRPNLARGNQFRVDLFSLVSAPFDLKYSNSLAYLKSQKSATAFSKYENRNVSYENFIPAYLMTKLGF